MRGKGTGTSTTSRTEVGRLVSTTTRSLRKIASSMECVISNVVRCSARLVSCSSSCISSRVWASSAANGSSSSSTSGSVA